MESLVLSVSNYQLFTSPHWQNQTIKADPILRFYDYALDVRLLLLNRARFRTYRTTKGKNY